MLCHLASCFCLLRTFEVQYIQLASDFRTWTSEAPSCWCLLSHWLYDSMLLPLFKFLCLSLAHTMAKSGDPHSWRGQVAGWRWRPVAKVWGIVRLGHEELPLGSCSNAARLLQKRSLQSHVYLLHKHLFVLHLLLWFLTHPCTSARLLQTTDHPPRTMAIWLCTMLVQRAWTCRFWRGA